MRQDFASKAGMRLAGISLALLGFSVFGCLGLRFFLFPHFLRREKKKSVPVLWNEQYELKNRKHPVSFFVFSFARKIKDDRMLTIKTLLNHVENTRVLFTVKDI
jgi:hypothetical protein